MLLGISTYALINIGSTAADMTPALELLECAGSDTLSCCEEVVRYVLSSKGAINTEFDNTVPKWYWAIEIFPANVNGRDGLEFGCSSWDHYMGKTDSWGEVWPLFMPCLPGQVYSKAKLYDQLGHCVDEVDQSSHSVDWVAVRKSLQEEDSGVPRIQTLYKKFEEMKAHTAEWKAEEGRIFQGQRAVEQDWDDTQEKIEAGELDENCEKSQRSCVKSVEWQTKCLDLFPSLSLGSSRREWDRVEYFGNASHCNYEECLTFGLRAD